MDRPETDVSTEEASESFVGWVASGLEEAQVSLARQIAFLEAHMAETHISQAKLLISAYEGSDDPALLEIESELRESYADYAGRLIHNKALSPHETVQVIKRLHDALEKAFASLDSFIDGYRRLTHLAIHLVDRWSHELLSAAILRLRKASDTAWFRVPLFAYGPELSGYRHRLR
ncbi:hypothetical protein LVW35_27870 [Pseudomonas sp. HN11]|uniref:hypothetical protein n=1 Tax=Pseudomonas sp. HN11 TaxID=1344094 RepID=UPI001F1C4050|nr:hypothetical protein [Pseudomonas sp. HN11]UII71401.1 hypothetical protein LVW35_27870 [Pseudomonas sp. HN11]